MLGFTTTDLFDTIDLFENKDMMKVIFIEFDLISELFIQVLQNVRVLQAFAEKYDSAAIK